MSQENINNQKNQVPYHFKNPYLMNNTMYENFNNNNNQNLLNNTNIPSSEDQEKNFLDSKINLINPNLNPNLNQNAIPPFMPAGNLMHPHPMLFGGNMKMVFPPQPFPGAQNLFPNIITEPLEIDNIFLFNKKFNIPNDKSIWYIYNQIHSMTSLPISSTQLFDLYNMKMINGEVDIRPIDIFQFAEQMPFSFVKFKVINDINWVDRIIDSQLLKFTELFVLSAKIKGEFSEKHRKFSKSSYGSNKNKINNKEYDKLAGNNNENINNNNYRNDEELFEVVGKKRKNNNNNNNKPINNNNNNKNTNTNVNTNNNQNNNQIQNKPQNNNQKTNNKKNSKKNQPIVKPVIK